MTLATIVSRQAHANYSKTPPIVVNGNVYVLAANTASGTGLAIFKASDPKNPSWTEQDSTNNPTTVYTLTCSWILEGSTIHIVSQTVGYASGKDRPSHVEYHTFNTSTDAWAITNESVEDVDFAGTGVLSVQCSGICVRPDGDVIVTYRGDDYSDMGTDYKAAVYARREGGTWTVGINLYMGTGPGTADMDYSHCVESLGFSGTVHFSFHWNSNVLTSSIDNSNSWIAASPNTVASSVGRNINMVAIDDKVLTHKAVLVCFRLTTGAGYVRIMYESSVTGQLQPSTAADAVTQNNTYNEAIFLGWHQRTNDGVAFVVYADTTNRDLYLDSSGNDGHGEWSGTDIEIEDAVDEADVSGVVWYDGWLLYQTADFSNFYPRYGYQPFPAIAARLTSRRVSVGVRQQNDRRRV